MATLQATYYGPDPDFFQTAFFNSATGNPEITVLSSSSTQVVVKQPGTGAVTTITGTGLQIDAAGTVTGGTITGMTFVQGGATVATFSGVSWDAVSFQNALLALPGDSGPLDALFSAQPVEIDASPASAGFGLDARGWTSNITIFGSDYKDLVIAGSGDDLLNMGNGDDLVRAGKGNDTLRGGNGNDALVGGAGNDLVLGGAGRDSLAGLAGDDTLKGGGMRDLLAGGKGNDKMLGQAGNDAMAGGDGRDLLKGGAGNDVMAGDAGNDRLAGQRGADVLMGGDGKDTLNGGAGDDSLQGGKGDDRLVGGAGADIFIFDPQAGNDVIADFEDTTDLIDVKALGLSPADITITAVGADTLVTLGNQGAITLVNVDATLISVADDFILA